ncbi:HAD family hydrolase [Streptomyces silvisoli]|uniref:HAD family hydrolase n=1 Tax=Streptomyces silvisoli TaxID=3034235 RepID=A0ABT5ZF77_9ACTN|nr:HAD family hydrolase [Streptomyces silvisoli]MDF3288480.1 HAD family hydrolase [Streptomyces silvisoli]
MGTDTGTDSLASALASSSGVLFDFDGPICHVFRGLPATLVARELSQAVAEYDPTLSAKTEGIEDPLEILRLSQQASKRLVLATERTLQEREIEAVAVAGDPTSGASSAIQTAYASGRGVAIVSNNSEQCVRAFLNRHGLLSYVHVIVGRPEHQPERMKPHPYSVRRAVQALDMRAEDCALLGDSVTDIEAAHAARTKAIGFANKPHKYEALRAAGADAITSSMSAVAEALA